MNYWYTAITGRIGEIKSDGLPGYITKAYVITTDKANYVIDTLFGKGSASHITEHLDRKLNTYIINTHYHWDHIWGNGYFNNAEIVCHGKCYQNIREQWTEMCERRKECIDEETKMVEPNIEFEDGLVLNGEMRVFYSPGHTNDSISLYYEKEGALFVGDNIGDFDTELVPSVKEHAHFIETLDRYLAINARHYLSSHNEMKTRETIQLIKDLYRKGSE